MKRICKIFMCVTLCAILLSLPLFLVACDNKIGKYDIRQFYGVCEAQNDYCTVYFRPQWANKDYELSYLWWNVTSVGENSFTYIDDLHGGQLVEKECDAFLLKSLRRLMGIIMSKSVTLSDGLIYLNDSKWEINYDTVYCSSNQHLLLYRNNIEVGAAIYSLANPDNEEDKSEIKLFNASVYDDYVIDEDGVEWEIIVTKIFIKK